MSNYFHRLLSLEETTVPAGPPLSPAATGEETWGEVREEVESPAFHNLWPASPPVLPTAPSPAFLTPPAPPPPATLSARASAPVAAPDAPSSAPVVPPPLVQEWGAAAVPSQGNAPPQNDPPLPPPPPLSPPAVPSPEITIQQVLQWVAAGTRTVTPEIPAPGESRRLPEEAFTPSGAVAGEPEDRTLFTAEPAMPVPAVPLSAGPYFPEAPAPRPMVHIGALHVTIEASRPLPPIPAPAAPDRLPLSPPPVLRSASRLSRHYLSHPF